ncbi:hypothetical protein CK203_011970 [Vitis vinifera]|uniref:Uncharacterized protein n=1 Tax=Vitis vinifera TaxID=29760 RepID=A0A438K0G0_VITVI|nr:hypothetical protein CK203_011970 [Vitis vinifera]
MELSAFVPISQSPLSFSELLHLGFFLYKMTAIHQPFSSKNVNLVTLLPCDSLICLYCILCTSPTARIRSNNMELKRRKFENAA